MTRTMVNNKNKEKFNLKALRVYILLGICSLLTVFSIFMTIESATSGAEITSLQNKEMALLAQQQDLQTALVQNLSIGSLQEKSSEMGFTKVSNLVYVSTNVPVAELPSYAGQ